MEEKKPAELLPSTIIDTQSILELIKNNYPEMVKIRDKAVGRMSQITAIADDDDAETVNAVLVNSKAAIERVMNYRKEITAFTDSLKKEAMEPEKEIATHDERLRSLLQQFNQAKLDEKRKIEEAAAAKKRKEDHKVDLEAKIKKNLSAMVVDVTKEADQWSKKFFEAAPVEDFDKSVEKFKSVKPALKKERYDAQFQPSFDKNIITQQEYDKFIAELKEKKEYSFTEWAKSYVELVTVTLNAWHARVDDIKSEKIAIAKAKGEEKERLEKEKAERDAAEEQRKKDDFERLQQQANSTISEEAEISKMTNSFVQQATVQNAGDKGLVKKVLKFNSREKQVKAFTTIILQCMAHKDFPGFQKKDKNKNPVVDDKGRPEYIEPVQWWINFFLSKCDAEIDGTTVMEDSKVVVRK